MPSSARTWKTPSSSRSRNDYASPLVGGAVLAFPQRILNAETGSMTEQILAETLVAGYVAPVFTVVRSRRQPRQSGEWAPAINVFDTGRAFVVIAELAGVGPDSLRIELDTGRDRLTLRGTRITRSPGESV